MFGVTIKSIISDNAYELVSSNEGIAYYESLGIVHQKSAPTTPQPNGLVERKHKHVLEIAHALYFQSGLGNTYWGECVTVATHLINRIPSTTLAN